MQHHFTRQELFDLVWSEPMREVATRFHFSDVALGKICKRYDVPIPYRGYWAKLRAGKSVVKAALPTRKPGMTDAITNGQAEWRGREIDDLEAAADVIPPAPQYTEPLEELRRTGTEVVKRAVLARFIGSEAVMGMAVEAEKREPVSAVEFPGTGKFSAKLRSPKAVRQPL